LTPERHKFGRSRTLKWRWLRESSRSSGVVSVYKSLLLAALLALALPAQVLAGSALPRVASPDQIQLFINTYRKHPEPKLLPPAVRAMAELGLLSDEEPAAVYIGFIAGVLGDNQLKAEKLVSAMLPLPADAQAVVVRAIAYSGLPNWRGILNDFVWRMPERKVLIDKLVTTRPPLLMDMPVSEGRTLDMLWGFYLATGSYQPVQRVVSALPWAADRDDLDRLVVGSMAKWTLASNAAKDQQLLKLLKEERKVASVKVGKPLQDVIDAVEIAETGKIKKEALAAIDELKIKGPASKRTMAWGSELGATAIAAGCVVASVTGHVELGIPCVVGGAMTQAAGKIMTSDTFSGWSARMLGLTGN
jgi:hypothetical protein